MSLRQIRPITCGSWLIPWCVLVLLCSSTWAQSLPTSSTPGRRLAPDALRLIPPAMEFGETFQGPVDLPLVLENPDLQWDPNYAPKSETLYEMGRGVIFRGPVHCLEFAFKPVRTIQVELPTASGTESKLVWYLLYRVRYLGGDLEPVAEDDPYDNQVFATPRAVSADWVRFMPTFRLEAKGLDREYLDQILPTTKRAIAARERVGRPLYDSVEIQKLKIEISTEAENHEVWGLATWVDVDPRVDFFAVQVQGLTNAQQLEQEGTEIRFKQKTLVLHFSRPGDTVNEAEDRIRYGIPALEDRARQKYVLDQFGVEERLDHMWVYR